MVNVELRLTVIDKVAPDESLTVCMLVPRNDLSLPFPKFSTIYLEPAMAKIRDEFQVAVRADG